MPATDGQAAGHGAETELPAPPSSTGKYGREAVKMILQNPDEETLLTHIKSMWNAKRAGAWIATLEEYGDRLPKSVDYDYIHGRLLRQSTLIQQGEISQPDDWARTARAVRQENPEWEETTDGDPRDRQGAQTVAKVGGALDD